MMGLLARLLFGRDDSARKATRRREMCSWVGTHGSEHLRRTLDEGYSPWAIYLRERLIAEFPGAKICRHARKWRPLAQPSIAAFDARARVIDKLVELGLCDDYCDARSKAILRAQSRDSTGYFPDEGAGEEAVVFPYRPGGGSFDWHTAVLFPRLGRGGAYE